MRRALKWLFGVLAVLLLLPALLLALAFGALNTDAGQRLAERAITRFGDGIVTIEGLSGRFPDALRVARVAVRDEKGVWLTVQGAELDWLPSRLLDREVRITRLAAADITLARLPAPTGDKNTSTTTGGGSGLPLPVVVDSLHVERLSVRAAVAGAAAVLAADGHGRLDALDAGSADLSVHRVDGGGSYQLHAAIASTVSATVAVQEPAEGLLAALADLPDVGALSLNVTAEGPWSAIASHLALTAGALTAAADGRVDVPGEAADIELTGDAPAMAPRPDVLWQSVRVDAHVQGKWTAPQVRGTVVVAGLSAAGASLQALSATLSGDLGRLTVAATADGLRIPGPAPDLLAATPVALQADARLDDPARPVAFTLAHKLLSLTGSARTADVLSAQARLELPDLGPLAALGAPPMQGHAAFDLVALLPGGAPSLTGQGTVAITGGAAPLPGLLGPAAHVGFMASLHDDVVELSRFQVDGAAATLAAHGTLSDALDLSWQAALRDLSVLAPTVQGDVQAQGRAHGPLPDLSVEADATGNVATAKVPRQQIKLSLAAKGLPDAPSAVVHADGSFDGAPLVLDITADRQRDATLHLAIGHAEWKSFHAEGALSLAPGAQLPAGRVTLRMDRLADLAGVLGQPVAGAFTAEVAAEGDQVRVQATARNTAVPGAAGASTASLDLRIRDPLGARAVEGSFDLAGLNAAGIGGTARLELKGTPAALALQLRTALTGVGAGPLTATAAARLDAPGGSLAIASVQVNWQGETLRLLAPARIGFADGVRVDRMRLGVRDAVLEVAGRFSPTLDLTGSLRTPADLATVFAPQFHPAGSVQADVRLIGAPNRPDGRLHLAATGLHLRSGPGSAMPPAALLADATLAGGAAQVTARFSAGRNDVSVTGRAPLDPSGTMDLHAAGAIDLAVLDPVLAGAGRRARGQVTLDGTLTGSPAQPRAGGTLRLAGGDFQDIGQGVHLSAVEALVEGTGDSVRLVSLSGRAGPGTVSASGSLGLADPMPVELTISGKHARPITSNLLTADLDLDLALRGEARGQVTLGGTVTVNRADIRVPEQLPAKVAVLDVRRPGQAPPPAAVAGPDIGLNVTLRAPGQVFVRGRGVFAELQGRVTLAGSVNALQPSGRFTLRRGTFNLAGQTLTFSTGDIGFDGGGFDPTLNLVATSYTASVTATLTVTGTASAPKLTLTSVPELPQDEILAQLLFHQSAGSLNGLQLAQSAAALAQISGVGGGFDPLNSIRQRLGLDRLAVGSNSAGNGASLEAGRYVAPGIFVGAKQSSAGGGTQATVQFDVTRRLKLEATVGTGGAQSATGATATSDPTGSSVGVTYQFDY